MTTKVIEQITEKVVGTSFQEHKDILEFTGEYNATSNVPTKVGVDNCFSQLCLTYLIK